MAQRVSNADLQLFDRGLVQQLAGRQLRPARVRTVEAKLGIVLLAWLPLAILSTVEHTAFRHTAIPFFRDFAVHVRLLVELPCLLFGMALARRLLGRSIDYVKESALVPEDRKAQFHVLIASTRRASNTPIVPVVILGIAWAASWLEMAGWVEMSSATESSWRAHHGSITNAGLWFSLVARPILYAQLGLWIYRFLLWTRVLAHLARIIKPIPAHPDDIGGLAPLNVGHDAFAPIALVIGADLAAGLANHLVHLNEQLSSFRVLVAAIVVTTTFVLLAPMLFFVPGLYRARVEALFSFHEAATIEARRIDEAIAASPTTGEPSAEAFKHHNHIAESLKRVRDMRLLPIHRRSLIVFLAAVTLPFVLAALSQLSPLDMIERVHQLTELAPKAVER